MNDSTKREKRRSKVRRERNPKAGATYRGAGVDIDAGNEMVRRIGPWVKATYGKQVLPGVAGGFGGFFRLQAPGRKPLRDPVLVGCTDGVGTKLKVAFLTRRLDTVGIDLVAMCVNDLIVGGAKPLFFLDYIGTGRLDPADLEVVVRGIAEGCRQADCALLGGETAEMPGFYEDGEFDLAGFAVGVVEKSKIVDGRRVAAGDAVIGLASSGLHSNGFSLVRRVLLNGSSARELERVVPELGRPLGEELLEPTRIYVQPLLAALDRFARGAPIRAVAHITGGGLVENIPRVLPADVDVVLRRGAWTPPPIFDLVQSVGRVARAEMDRVFNNGLGLVLVVAPARAAAVVDFFRARGEDARIVGEVVPGRQRVRFSR
ncbi:MAG: phosphoribosylformylglycinamidine cyclo-ligase [Planctomycetota bacterium]